MKKIVTTLMLLLLAVVGCASTSPPTSHDTSTACSPRRGVEVRLVSETGQGERTPAWSGDAVMLEPTAWIASADVDRIEVVREPGSPRQAISVHLHDDARARFERLTSEHVGRRAAIVVDGRVASALTIRDAVRSPALLVTGASDADVATMTRALCELPAS